MWIAILFNRPEIANLYGYTPTYSIENIRSWVLTGAAVHPTYLPSFDLTLTRNASLLILISWIVGLMLLVIFFFQRQDLTS